MCGRAFYVILMLIFKAAPSVAIDCLALRFKASSLSGRCCRLTNPQLDPGYAESAQELLPALPHRKFTLNERLAIYIESYFIGNGYLETDGPDKLDLTSIKENLLKFVPAPANLSTEFLLQAYKSCEGLREAHKDYVDIKYPKVDIFETDCNPFAAQISVCVRIYGMQECMEGFYVNTAECVEARAYFRNCVANVKTS